MHVKARRVGNSLTVTIPKQVVEELSIREDTDLDVTVEQDAVVIRPAASKWERLIAESRSQAKARGLSERDVLEAIARIRGRKS